MVLTENIADIFFELSFRSKLTLKRFEYRLDEIN